jgi:hypothetical protein
VVEALSASRALSGPELNGKSATKSMAMTVNNDPLHFMARPPDLKKRRGLEYRINIASKHIGLLPD